MHNMPSCMFTLSIIACLCAPVSHATYHTSTPHVMLASSTFPVLLNIIHATMTVHDDRTRDGRRNTAQAGHHMHMHITSHDVTSLDIQAEGSLTDAMSCFSCSSPLHAPLHPHTPPLPHRPPLHTTPHTHHTHHHIHHHIMAHHATTSCGAACSE